MPAVPVSQYSMTFESWKSASRSSPSSWAFQASSPNGESVMRVGHRLRLFREDLVERHLVLEEPLERPQLGHLLRGHARELGRVARREREDLGDVDADHVLGVEPADLRRDHRAGVVARRAVALVAEAAHQLDPRRRRSGSCSSRARGSVPRGRSRGSTG